MDIIRSLSVLLIAGALALASPASAGSTGGSLNNPGVNTGDDPLVWTGDHTFDGLMDMGTDEVFDSADTTPNVSTGSLWTSNATGVTITDFDGTPVDGQLLYVRSGGATVYDCTAAGLDCGTADFTTAAGHVTVWMYDGTNWDRLAWFQSDVDLAGFLPLSGGSLSGDLTVDSIVFHVDAADDFVGFGTATSDTVNQVLFKMDGAKDILIDGATNPRTVDIGTMRFEQKPAIENTRAITLNINANSQPNTHAVVINVKATGIVAGESISAYDVNIDKNTSTGGVARAFEVSQTGGGSIAVTGLHIDPGVAPLSQNSGTFGAIEQAFTYDSAFADTTAAFNATGTDVSLFVSNGDFVYIGDAATFNGVSIVLDTFASNPGVKTLFAYSDGVGGWTAFTPSDETQGFRQDGLISWTVSDLAGWSTDTVNAVGAKYWIRFARNTSAGITVPIEDIIQIASSISYGWDEDGNLDVNAGDFAGDVTMGPGAQILMDDGTISEPALVRGTPAATAGGLRWITISDTDVLVYTFAGGSQYLFDGNRFRGGNANSSSLINATSSATTPTVVANQSDADSGFTSAGPDQPGIAAGGVEAMRWEEASSQILLKYSVHAGLTANSGGGGVGSCLQLLSSFNEISTVAAGGDSVCVPVAVAGYPIVIINNGANAMDVYPNTDDNLGGGVNTAVSLAAGSNIRYFAYDATNWESI